MHIYKASRNGKISYRVDRRYRGRRIVGNYKRRSDAVLAMERKMRQVDKQIAKKQTMSLGFIGLCTSYLKDKKLRVNPVTFAAYKNCIKRFLRHYKSKEWPQPKHILSYIQSCIPVSGNYANTQRRYLLQVFNWGMKYGYCAYNPVLVVDKMRYDKPAKYVPPKEDIFKVLLVAGKYRDLLYTISMLAARKSEVFKMKWSDVDFENKKVRLWTKKRSGGHQADWMSMSQPLEEILRRRYENRNPDIEWVFPNDSEKSTQRNDDTGRYMTLNRLLPNLCKKAEVPQFTFHALRHWAATICKYKGMEAPQIQKLLRHRNLDTTQQYLAEIDDSTQVAATFIGEELFPAEEESESVSE